MRFSLALMSLLLVALPGTSGADELSHVRRVVLDPGHGGSNLGAVGVGGIYERFLTLETANLLRAEIQARYPGVEVLLTREVDLELGLSDRTHFANLSGADLLISIHYNAAVNVEARGVEVFYLASEPLATAPYADNVAVAGPANAAVASILHDLERNRLHAQSAVLAQAVHGGLLTATEAFDRGVRQAHFRVLRGALMPAVVVELGFLTHPDEGVRLLDPAYTDQLVSGLLSGIEAYDRSIESPQ